MGSWRTFYCEKCGLEAEVSGGEDVGMMVHTQTRYCPVCETLVDVEVQLTEGSFTIEEEFAKCRDRCGECDTVLTVDWNYQQPCPRCGGDIAASEEFIRWD